MDGAHAAFCYDGFYVGFSKAFEEWFANSLCEFVAEGAGFQAKCSRHATTGACFDEGDVCTALAQECHCVFARTQGTLVAGDVESECASAQGILLTLCNIAFEQG